MNLRFASILTIFLFQVFSVRAQKNPVTINDAGAWCWFSDPRAVYLHGDKKGVLTGWVKEDGSVETALINPKSLELKREILYTKLEKDDHDNPSFLEVGDNKFMAFYTKHIRKYLYYNHSDNSSKNLFNSSVAMDPISPEEFEKYPRGGVTYANPTMLSEENNRIYVFGRWTGFKPNVMWSDDHGGTFTKGKVLIAEDGFDQNNRPYVKYHSDGKSKIHIVFTDGHPRVEPLNSLYYVYYEKGSFWRVDGSKICDLDQLPFSPKEASVIYKANEENGRAWMYDIDSDKSGNPVILYARYPSEKDHIYYHAAYDEGKWTDSKICHAGKWFPQTPEGQREREPHYSAGLSLHPLNTNVVYLSREINGIFEIEKWQRKKNGKKWVSEAITRNSTLDNVRPYVPRNMKKGDKTVLLWMQNERYVHYTDYKSNIKFIVE